MQSVKCKTPLIMKSSMAENISKQKLWSKRTDSSTRQAEADRYTKF